MNGKRSKEKVLRVLGDTALFSSLKLPKVHQHHATSAFPRQSHLHLPDLHEWACSVRCGRHVTREQPCSYLGGFIRLSLNAGTAFGEEPWTTTVANSAKIQKSVADWCYKIAQYCWSAEKNYPSTQKSSPAPLWPLWPSAYCRSQAVFMSQWTTFISWMQEARYSQLQRILGCFHWHGPSQWW